jgi:hypothetical protein
LPKAIVLDDHPGGGGQRKDAIMEGLLMKAVMSRRDVESGKLPPVQLPGHTGKGKYSFEVIREDETLRPTMIQKRAETTVIPATKQALPAVVPDREGELA